MQRKTLLQICALLWLSLCSFTVLSAQNIESLEVASFMERYEESTDEGIIVYNFWATWCGPCVRELPHFEALNKSPGELDIKMVLVSLDFSGQEERLSKFVTTRDLSSDVIFLSDWSSEQDWIGQVSEDWTGAIPITILHHPATDQRSVHLNAFESEEDLRSWVNSFAAQIKD